MKKNKIQIIFGLFIIIYLLIYSLSPRVSKAATVDEKRREIDSLQQQINANRAELSKKAREASNLQNEVAIMDGQIRDAELKISLTQANINKNQIEIENLKEEIAQKEKELKVQRENLNETVRVIYEMGDQSLLEIVASSNNISEVVDRTSYLESVQGQITNTVNRINSLKTELEKNKADQEKKLAELDKLLGEQKNARDGLASQKSAKAQLLSETKGQEAAYRTQIAQKMAEWEKTAAELRTLEGGRIGVAGSYPVPFWPMNGALGVPFGACGCGAYFCGRCHTGIDLIAAPLTSIVAAQDGTVVDTNNSCQDFGSWSCGGGYGNYVKIRHDDGFLAIYGHMHDGSVRVYSGQRVSGGGTVLGLEGSTGFSTGYHLHFEIRSPSGVPVGASLP